MRTLQYANVFFFKISFYDSWHCHWTIFFFKSSKSFWNKIIFPTAHFKTMNIIPRKWNCRNGLSILEKHCLVKCFPPRPQDFRFKSLVNFEKEKKNCKLLQSFFFSRPLPSFRGSFYLLVWQLNRCRFLCRWELYFLFFREAWRWIDHCLGFYIISSEVLLAYRSIIFTLWIWCSASW